VGVLVLERAEEANEDDIPPCEDDPTRLWGADATPQSEGEVLGRGRGRRGCMRWDTCSVWLDLIEKGTRVGSSWVLGLYITG